jgi:AraC-like DNA-binding protein
LLEQVSKQVPAQFIPLSTWERARLEEARQVLLTHLGGPNITIRQLSRKVRLNEFKLKTGFRQAFGMGIFEYLTHIRLERAKELIVTTNRPLKDICTETGYARLTNFVTAFKRHFGYTPGLLRRS